MNRFKYFAASACWGLCMAIFIAGTTRASDTDIFTGGTLTVPPNVLIILDTSGSMANDVYVGTMVYDPATTYPTKSSPHYNSNTVYYKNGSSWTALEGSLVCTLKLFGHCITYSNKALTINDITCDSAKNSLSTTGQWLGYLTIKDSGGNEIYTYDCPAGSPSANIKYYQLAVGNYLNFKMLPTDKIYKPKIDVAKDAIISLLGKVDLNAVHIGLMRFHGMGTSLYLGLDEQNRGGYVVAKIGSTKSAVENALKDIKVWCSFCGSDDYTINPYFILGPTSSGSTPLAETLAEAGLYFAGKHSWANTSGQSEAGYPGKNNDFGSNGYYTSPIEWRCQKNYVVVITDGMPEDDYGAGNGENIFTRSDYINGKSIGRYYSSGNRDIDRDGDDDGTCIPILGCFCSGSLCQHWTDDTAKFLYDVDLIDSAAMKDTAGGSYNDPAFSPQRIVTYTIGFGSECDKNFLARVTDSNHGHGMNFMAEDADAIEGALTGIVGDILECNSNFVTPVVPVSRLNNIYSGNSIYISLFRPESGAVWEGNLKKFGYSNEGEILNKDLSSADFSGTDFPTSCWGSSVNDGIIVDKGGAGTALLGQTARNFYFYNKKAAVPSADLKNSANLFSVDNPTLTNATDNVFALGSSATADDRTDLIHFLRGDGVYQPGTGSNKREWVLGDILHSRPAVLRDGTKNIVFVGSNDGFLHCFVDEEGNNQTQLSDDSVSEAWCVTPYELLPFMHLMLDSSIHQYLVDGTPVVYNSSGNSTCYKLLTFGLRRGGPGYYTLKVGDVADGTYVSGGYLSPQYAWDIGEDKLGTNGPRLGQSWGDPHVCRIRTGATTETKALIISGGYDDDNQDKNSPSASDTAGMALFAVHAGDGSLIDSMKFTKASANLSSMTNCIVDLVNFDRDGDGCTDRIYAGDMGGRVFAMKQGDDFSWSGRQVFQAGDGTNATSRMKFFYPPDVTVQGFVLSSLYKLNDYVFIGSGDREHPNETPTQNRFYAVKNKDDGVLLKETDLKNVTSYSFYATANNLKDLKDSSSSGWFIKLGWEGGSLIRPGEKMVSSPLILSGVVYFTTYVPSTSITTTDRCYESAPGEGFLYALNCLTGEAVRELQFNTTTEQVNGTAPLTEVNRRISLGNGMPTQPKLTVTKSGPVLVIGTSIGTTSVKVPFGKNAKEYYWLHQ